MIKKKKSLNTYTRPCVFIAQSCPTLCDSMNCSPPLSCVHGILQARILEWVAMPSSRGSSWPKNWTRVSYFTGRFFTNWATREAPSGCLAKIKGTLLGVEWSGSWSHSKARSLGPRTIQVSFSQSWEALLNLWGIQERLWRSQVYLTQDIRQKTYQTTVFPGSPWGDMSYQHSKRGAAWRRGGVQEHWEAQR